MKSEQEDVTQYVLNGGPITTVEQLVAAFVIIYGEGLEALKREVERERERERMARQQ